LVHIINNSRSRHVRADSDDPIRDNSITSKSQNTVRIVNGTSENWDPSLFYATLQSGNQEASQVYDSGQLGDSPSTSLLPGREVQFQIAFGVNDPADLVLEVAPDFTYKNVIFHS